MSVSYRLGGAKQHVAEQSEKVRRLWAGLASESRGCFGNSVEGFVFGFAGAVWAAFGTE